MTGHGGGGAHHAPWWQHGLLSAGAGLVFATLLTVVLMVLARLEFGPVVALERAGVDMSMRVYAAFPRILGNRAPGDRQSYAFLDIDEDSCRAASGTDADACGTREPVPAGLVARLLDAVAQAENGPRVVILDIKPPEKPEARSAWRQALDRTTGPWIVLPVESRPGNELATIQAELDTDLLPRGPGGRARQAAVISFTDPEAGDGLVRHYPLLVRLRQGRTLVPTLPFVAAALAADGEGSAGGNARALDCAFYPARAADCPVPASPVRIGDRIYELAPTPGHKHETGIVLDPAEPFYRIFYSLPSLASAGDGSLADQYRHFYDRYPVSLLLAENGEIRLPPGLLRDSIVVIGSSEAAGHDWHATPLGALAGSEIVLNATRAIAEFAPMRDGRGDGETVGWDAIWDELLERLLPVALVGILLLGPAWLAIAWISAKASAGPRWLRQVSGLACCGIFLIAMGSGLATEIFLHTRYLQDSAQAGRAVDLFTPLLGLGLEGYADASVVVLAGIHAGLAEAAGNVGHRVRGCFRWGVRAVARARRMRLREMIRLKGDPHE